MKKEEIKELPPGARQTICFHLEPEFLPNGDTKVNSIIVWLEEIPSEVGYHGVCPTCGTRYFSKPNGAF